MVATFQFCEYQGAFHTEVNAYDDSPPIFNIINLAAKQATDDITVSTLI